MTLLSGDLGEGMSTQFVYRPSPPNKPKHALYSLHSCVNNYRLVGWLLECVHTHAHSPTSTVTTRGKMHVANGTAGIMTPGIVVTTVDITCNRIIGI